MGIKYYQQQTKIGIGEGAASYPTSNLGVSGSAIALAKTAQAFTSLGESAFKYGVQLNQRKNNEETSKAQVDFLTQLDSQYVNYTDNTKFTEFNEYTTNAKSQFDDLLSNSSKSISNSNVRKEFINSMRIAKEARYMDKIANKGRSLSEANFKNSIETDLNTVNALLQNPDSFLGYDEAIIHLKDKIDKYSEGQEISQEIKDMFFEQEQLKMIMSYSQGQIDKNPIAFKEQLTGNFEAYVEASQDPELKERLGKEPKDLTDKDIKDFIESDFAPIFTKELSTEVRNKLLVAANNKISAMQSAAEKAWKEQSIIEKEMFKKENEINTLSLENDGIPIQFNYIPKVVGSTANRLGQQYTTISKVAQEIGIDPVLFLSLLQQESGAQHIDRKTGKVITSKAGALGIGQLMPATAKGLGVDPYDEKQNLLGAAKYLQQQLKTFDGDISKVLAAYNAGPGAVKKYKGIPPYTETQDYVKKVITAYEKNKQKFVQLTATTILQEKAYNIELKATGSEAKATVALMQQRDKEIKSQLTYEVLSQVDTLYSEYDLQNYVKSFTEVVNSLSNTDPRKPLLLDKVKIVEDKVKEKLRELKTDPAGYVDKYSQMVDGLEGKTKYEARIAGQKAMGIPDGGVKVLSKTEEDFYIKNITEQLSPDARVSTIRELQNMVGPENYGLAIRQLSNKNSTLHAAYWMLPQLDKVNSQGAIDVVNALKYFDEADLKEVSKQRDVKYTELIATINTKLDPLIGPSMLVADPQAAKGFRETANLLGLYYSTIATDASTNDIAQMVEKVLLEDSYDIVDSGWFTDSNILVAKGANLNPQAISKVLNMYSDVPFDVSEILVLDDLVKSELSLGTEAYEEQRDLYNDNFLSIVNSSIVYMPTVTGTGVYVGYDSPTANRPLLLFDKDQKPIYIDFARSEEALKDIQEYKHEIYEPRFVPTPAGVQAPYAPATIKPKTTPLEFKSSEPYNIQVIRSLRRK